MDPTHVSDFAWEPDTATAKTPTQTLASRDDDDKALLAAFLAQGSGVPSELSTTTYAFTGWTDIYVVKSKADLTPRLPMHARVYDSAEPRSNSR